VSELIFGLVVAGSILLLVGVLVPRLGIGDRVTQPPTAADQKRTAWLMILVGVIQLVLGALRVVDDGWSWLPAGQIGIGVLMNGFYVPLALKRSRQSR
jgi:heme A synthase